MVVIMVALDRSLLDRPVHQRDLAVGLGMLDLGQPVFDLMLVADPIKDVVERVFVLRYIDELDAVVGQYGVDDMRHCSD